MTTSMTTRCLFCRTGMTGKLLRPSRMGLHTSAPRPEKQNAPPSSYRPGRPKEIEEAARHLLRYTPEEWAKLSQRYTPEQLKAIEAGEEAVDPGDLMAQGTFRTDHNALYYLEDFSEVKPIIDKSIRNPESNYDPRLRYKSEDEILEDYVKLYEQLGEQNVPESEARLALRVFEDEYRFTKGKEAAELAPTSYLSPDLPKVEDGLSYDDEDNDEFDPLMRRVYQHTGFSSDEVRRFRVKTLVSHRVVNQTRMGKIASQYMLAVAGDGRGLLGYGEGKASEAEGARLQAERAAISNMQPILRYEERTIFGEVEAKVGAAVVKLMARPPGFGLRCQAYIFEIGRCVGISDMAARVLRSHNPMNVVKATVKALQMQRDPEVIARARGRKLIDVRKVYYGGQHLPQI